MNIFKFLCCKEQLRATITIGDITTRPNSNTLSLEAKVQLSISSIKPQSDFLYLSPQASAETIKERQQQNVPAGQTNIEDEHPLPKRVKDVHSKQAILIEKGSALCENVGYAYVDLCIERGKYKLYYMRIENDQRIMPNSRLEVLGSSTSFTINKVNSQQQEDFDPLAKGRQFEESGSFTSQGESEILQQKRRNLYDESSSLDSVKLMNQFQATNGLLQNYQSSSRSEQVNSQDNTKMLQQSPCSDLISVQDRHLNDPHTTSSNYYSEQSASSHDSSQTFIVKTEMAPKSHKRCQNFSQQQQQQEGPRVESGRVFQKPMVAQKKPLPKSVKRGKENRVVYQTKAKDNPYYEFKSLSFTNGSQNKTIHVRGAADDELRVRYVQDIESLVPPKFNPDTRTYFKLSIYSPSNRLYTVNEEINSTQSEMNYTEQFSQLLNSCGIKSGRKSKVCSTQRASGGRLDNDQQVDFQNLRDLDLDAQIIEESEENMSESIAVPTSPIASSMAKFIEVQPHKKVSDQASNYSNAHTRTNSSKGHSMKGSVVARASPKAREGLETCASTLQTAGSCPAGQERPLEEQKKVAMFLADSLQDLQRRQEIAGSLAGKKLFSEENRRASSKYSPVCTGGTEFCRQPSGIRDCSPAAYFDEVNKQVVIVAKDPVDGQEVEHCIRWQDDTDPCEVERALESVISLVSSHDLAHDLLESKRNR